MARHRSVPTLPISPAGAREGTLLPAVASIEQGERALTRRTRSVLGGMAAAVALMAVPAASQAACSSSTPSSQAIADSPVDGQAGLAPEMAGVGITVDGACGVSFDPVLTNRPSGLIDGDGVGIYVDTDGNPATGSPTFNGADRVIITAGLTGPDTPPGLGTWNGATFDFTSAPLLPAVGQGGARAVLDQLGVAAPGTINVRVATIWLGVFDSYGDFAPEPGTAPFSLPLAFSTQAPAPTPAVPVAAPSPAPTRTLVPVKAGATTRKSCRVPNVKGMKTGRARARLKAAGCRYTVRPVTSKGREGRVVSTSKRAGVKTSAMVVVKVSRGRARTRARIASVDAGAVYAATSDRLIAARESGTR
jgi:PASTA domain-containing protein